MIRTTLCCCLIALGCASLAAQKSDPRESKLLVLEHLWNEAQVQRDSAALDALVSSRFINTEYDGELSDKQKFLADIRDPLFRPTAANIQDVKMNFFGDTAVITGIYHTQGTYQGKPDTPPYSNAPFNGNRAEWDKAIATRNQNQNEYKRVR